MAQIAYLLLLFGGIWMVAAQIPAFGVIRGRTVVAGLAFAVAGLLLFIATHYGHFG